MSSLSNRPMPPALWSKHDAEASAPEEIRSTTGPGVAILKIDESGEISGEVEGSYSDWLGGNPTLVPGF